MSGDAISGNLVSRAGIDQQLGVRNVVTNSNVVDIVDKDALSENVSSGEMGSGVASTERR